LHKAKRQKQAASQFQFVYLLFILSSLLWLNACVSHKSDDNTYKRTLYSHWIDEDSDCQNVRHELLIATSTKAVTFTNNKQCTVKTGLWFDVYTGESFNLASDLDIDHIVPLAHAHYHGAANWDRKKRQAFANDLKNLLAVDDATNQEKSAKAPHQWMPARQAYWCEYLAKWQAVKNKYHLQYSQEERTFIKDNMQNCPLAEHKLNNIK